MPKAIGNPVTIAVTNGQPQREVARFVVDVTYDSAGSPHFAFQGIGVVRLRDSAGNIVVDNITAAAVIETLSDAQLPAGIRTAFTNICTHLDTV
jgi:hypothetical protein